jgi:outer membrane protein, heavy metal efflux system
MRTRSCCVAAALVCLSRLAAAQTVLSEADALARLSTESPRVRAIQAAVDVARADALAAGRWPNPRVTFNRESVAGVTENMFLVTQPLSVTGRRGLDMSAASALVVASERRAEEDIRQVRAALRSAYADLVSAQVREAEIAAARDRMRGLAEILARREAAGEAAGYDRLRAEREVMDLEADGAAARADRLLAPVSSIMGI